MKYISILLILVFLKPLNTVACKCMSFPPLSFFDIQKSDLAFIGTCEKIIKIKDHNYAIFNVSLLIKGSSQFKIRVTILSSNNGSGDCMQTFYTGEKWLVIAKRTLFGFYASHCDNNELVIGDALSKIREIAPGYPFSNQANSDFFYDENEIRIKGEFVKGKEEGYWYYYYQNQLRYKILYHRGEIKELHQIRKNYYELVLFKNQNIIKIKGVSSNEKREILIKYTPKETSIKYYLNRKLDFKLTIDLQKKDIIVLDNKGVIVSKSNYLKESPNGHINPVYQFFMRSYWYLDKPK